MNMAAPSGVVTFLFTDIEGSTWRWEADAEAMRMALETHDAVLREAVAAHDGWLFKHTGDGVCAAFASPKSAVDAAVAAQRTLELPVRMGIATGEAELRGSDYFGTVLNLTARLMSAGHGGQILVDGTTAASAKRSRCLRPGFTAITGHRQTSRGVPSQRSRSRRRLSTAENVGFDAGKHAATGHQLHRT